MKLNYNWSLMIFIIMIGLILGGLHNIGWF